MMYSDEQIRKVAEYARHNGIRPTARKFGVSRSVGRWKRGLINKMKTGDKQASFRKPGQGRKLSYPKEFDEQLVQWLLELRDAQIAMSSDMLKKKGRVLITPVVPSFKASNGWCQKFYR